MDDDPVADEGDLAVPDDARGQEVEVVGLFSHHHSVSGVVAALQKMDTLSYSMRLRT